MKPKKLVKYGLIAMLSGGLILLLPACDTGNIGAGGVVTQAQSCEYNDNLNNTADSFISRCRKAGIRQRFPGGYYQKTLKEIKRDKSADGKRAYKLLNDGRFKK